MSKKPPLQLDIIETASTINRLPYLFSRYSFDLLDAKNISEPYYSSILIEILIHLRDLLFKLDVILNDRITFTDDVDIRPDLGIKDITDLVRFMRDAACHNTSPNRRGKAGNLYASNLFANDVYDDDIAFIMGQLRIYVRRHLFRLFPEVLLRFEACGLLQGNNKFEEALKIARLLDVIPQK